MPAIKDVPVGEYVKSEKLCRDDLWHQVRAVEPQENGEVFVDLEGFGPVYVDGTTEVEVH